MSNDGFKQVPLSKLDDTTATQVRATMSMSQIKHYADRMEQGDSFPPIVVYELNGKYVIADGFHRVAAARLAKMDTIACRVETGDAYDLLVTAISSNREHGLPMTKQDRVRAVHLHDKFTTAKLGRLSSAREVAEVVGCSHTTVNNIRKAASAGAADFSSDDSEGIEKIAKADIGKPAEDRMPVELRKELAEPIPVQNLAFGKAYADRMLTLARDLKALCKQWGDEPYGAHIASHANTVNTLIGDISTIVKACKPAALCDRCEGEGCESCNNSGMLAHEQAKAIEKSKAKVESDGVEW